MKFQQFVEELQRRHVLRVAGGYLLASWFLIESSSTVLPYLVGSDEGVRWVIFATIAMVPVVLLLAWFFDFTKHGIVRTPPVDATSVTQPMLAGPQPQPVQGAAATAGNAQLQHAAAPAGRVVLSARATGMFGLGALVAIASLAAYSTGFKTVLAPAVVADEELREISSIAVLTFTDMSESRDQQYFAEGMTEELLSSLAQLDGLRVVSGRRFADSRSGDIREIADALNVEAVLEGSVRRSPDSVRVTVNVIGARTDAVLFSRTFTRAADEVLRVQDEIAATVTSAMQLQRASGLADANGVRSTNPQALDLYRRGMSSLRERTDADLRAALKFFNEAIALDSTYAAAYAGLAQTYAVLPTVTSYPFDSAGTLGSRAAALALARNPKISDAFAALGQINQNLAWDPAGAEVHYRRATEMQNSATAHQWYAESLMMLGRTDEAMAEINNALSLEPGAPAAQNTLAYLLTVMGKTDSALVVFRRSGQLNPEYRLGHLTHALTAVHGGRFGEAEAAVIAYAQNDAALARPLVAVVRGVAGTAPRPAALTAARSLERLMGPSFTALWLAALQDRKGALEMLTRAYEQRSDANFPYFVIHPLLKPIHGEPAYRTIVSEIGVTPAR